MIGNSPFRTRSFLAKGKFNFGQDRAQSLIFSHSRTTADNWDVFYDQCAAGGGNFDQLTDTAQTVLEYRCNPARKLINLRANLSYADQKIGYDYIAGSYPL